MMLRGKAFVRRAELEGDMITVYADVNTKLTRPVREGDKVDWPELFKDAPPPKRKRKRKVSNDTPGDVESGAE
jgi:hypothetical protein